MKRKLIIPIEFDHLQGGMIFSVISLINGLAGDFHIYVLAHKEAEIFKLGLNIQTIKIDSPWSIGVLNPFSSIRTYLQVRKALKNFDYNDTVVLTNNIGSELTLSGFGFFPVKLKRAFVSRGGELQGKTGWFLRKSFQSCSAFVATSNKQLVALNSVGAPSSLITIINGGVPDSCKQAPVRGNDRVRNISVVGYIDFNKNQMLAIEALSILLQAGHDVYLNIFGVATSKTGMVYEEMLVEKIASLKLEKRVLFRGFVADPYAIYNETDLLISCSLTEGFGRTLVEAMSFGIPCIALREAGGVLDIITDEYNGILIRNDREDLSGAIRRIIEDRELYHKLSTEGRKTFEKKFTEDIMINKFRTFLSYVQ